MVDDPARARPGSLLGPPRSVRLRLVRAANVTLGTDPSLVDLYQARYEGAPPKVRARGGLVAIEYGPGSAPATGPPGRRHPAEPVGRLAHRGGRGITGLRADLSAARLLGMEVEHAAANSELTLARPAGPVRCGSAGPGRSPSTARRHGRQGPGTGGSTGLSFDDVLGGGRRGRLEDLRLRQATDRYDIDSRGRPRRRGRQPGAPARRRPAGCWHGPVHRHRRVDPAGPGGRRPAVAGAADAHDEAARRLVGQEGGRRIKSTGDGVLAVFDGPAGRSAAPSPSARSCAASASRSGPGSTPGSSTSATTTSAGSRSTSAPASWPPPAPARSWSPGPSGTWSPAPASPWRPAGPNPQGPGRPVGAVRAADAPAAP